LSTEANISANEPNGGHANGNRRDAPQPGMDAHSTQRRTHDEPIAIVGMSCLFPKAQSIQEYWSNIKNRVDAITDVPESHWRPEDYFDADPKRPDHTYCSRGGFLDPVEFDPVEYGISPKSIEATDTAQLLSLVVAQGAMADAGYSNNRPFNRERVSVILGVTGTLELAVTLGGRLGHPIWRRALSEAGVHPKITEEVVQNIGDAYVAWQEDSFPGLLGNVVAGRIANRFDLGGTNCVVDAACASSISAVHLAAMELESGRADMVITGGVDAFNDVFMYMCFSKTPALSPTGDSRPFDATADGTILGEGVGMIVLKRLADAERDGDRIYAVIKGVGSSSDGRGKAIYAPSSSGQVRALRAAYERAGVSPATVELVESHGTGTRVGDATEVAALKEVYRESGRSGVWCALGSVKSQIGHTKAAAGVAGLIKAALALRHKVLPPTIKVDQPNPAVEHGESPFYINTEKRPWLPRRAVGSEGPSTPAHLRRAAVSSFGFGGSNFHLVMEEHGAEKSEIDWDGRVEIVALSSQNLEGLKDRLRAWSQGIEWSELKREAAQSRRDFKSSDPYRLLLVLERDKINLRNFFRRHLDSLEKNADRASWMSPDGAYFGGPRKVGKLGFLFPGQGSQYVGMALDLACLFPKMQEVLTEADLAYSDMTDLARQLSDFIFHLPVFNEEARRLNEMALRATQRAQPAIGAISMGAICILAMFGVHPAAAAGHSFGELVALFAGGRIGTTALHQLSQLRGHLMAQAAGEAGAMLAVQAACNEVERICAEENLNVVIANKNAPDQMVISGSVEEVERAASAFRTRKLPNTRLPVSAAFHSPLIADAQRPFREALDQIEFDAPVIPVYSNVTAREYPAETGEVRELLGQQLGSPVEFVRMIEQMHADGVTTFLEVGPGARLTGLVKSILGDRDFSALSIDASSGRGSGLADFAKALAQLAALGHPVNLTPWENGEATLAAKPQKSRRMTISICGANYRAPRGEPKHHATAPPIQIARTAMNEPSISNDPPMREDDHTPRAVDAPPPDQPPKIAGAGLPPAAASGASAAPPASHFAASSFSQTSPSQLHSHQFAPVADPLVAEALRRTQESLQALQDLQTKTAQLHRQFLEGQERAQQTYQWLLQQQQSLYLQALGVQAPTPALPPLVAAAPSPSASPAPALPISSAEPSAQPILSVSDSPNASRFAQVLLEVVSDKTGYPIEMLGLDMDLESDLGIDSIKRVEILSAVQELIPEAPVVQPEEIGKLRTLNQVIAVLQHSIPAPTLDGNGSVASSALDATIPSPHSSDAFEAIAAPRSTAADYQQALIEIVSEKTGYPPDMLNLDMDMESDLGIDSIKRVEILSAFQERFPDAPVVQPEDVSKLRTLAQVIAFLGEPAIDTPLSSPAPVTAPPPQATLDDSTPDSHARAPRLRRAVLDKVLLPRHDDGEPLRFCEGAVAAIVTDGSPLSGKLKSNLETAGLKTMLVSIGELLPPAPRELSGLIILAPAPASGESPSENSERWLKQIFGLVQWAARPLRENGKASGAFLATVSRLDGAFGLLNWTPELDPLQGGLAGLAKTAWHEWPEVSCRAIDVAADWDRTDEVAAAIAEEVLRDGPVEIGMTPSCRWTLDVVEAPLPNRRAQEPLIQSGDVVVISGGARGVTAETALALAKAYQPKLLLLGRSPVPAPEPNWLQGLEEESEIKKAILIRGNGSITSPKVLEDEFRRLSSNREILRNLKRIESAGSTVVYRQVDVRNERQVARVIDEARRDLGPIRGIVHGAGVLADRRIEDKTADQFELVLSTKVAGARALVDATKNDDLRFAVFFSSVSARYGRSGQVDYAIANEVLNKLARQQSRLHPNARVLSIGWGPWDGGMVNEGLKKVFRSEGVGLIPLEAGAQFLVDELASDFLPPIEIVVTAESHTAPRPHTGNGKAAAASQAAAPKNGAEHSLPLAFTREIDLARHPYLRSHSIKNRPVVPVAMIVEWLAHGALHENPGFVFFGLDHLKVLRSLAVEEGEVCRIQVRAEKARGRAAQHQLKVELRSGESGEVLHATADVLIAGILPPAEPAANGLHAPADSSRDPQSLYREVLFHGEHFQGLRAIDACYEEGVIADLAAAPPPDQWTAEPLRSSWIADPLALDSALQLGVMWTAEIFGMPSLPSEIVSYRQFRNRFPAEGVKAIARGKRHASHLATLDIDLVDREGALVARMRGCEFVMDAALYQAFGRGPAAEHANA
jgi:acyl transferase domain-containing protein/NAD(P)-dependent dehydrogenase (short-subunit alcohol dehydrogenase family)